MQKKRITRNAAKIPAADTPLSMANAEMESSLYEGRNTPLLQEYFGKEDFAEIQDLAAQVKGMSVRGRRPRVLLLPGIMGSTIGWPGTLWDRVLWLDPVRIALGEIGKLGLSSPDPKLTSVGVILIFYLKMKLRLILAGFNADFFHYDWRLDLRTLGGRLKSALAEDKAGEVHLVAHSMGGLVCRAAVKQSAPKIASLTMLGTPNFGAYGAIAALLGQDSMASGIAALDLKHTVNELVEHVLSTLPGLYSLLPAPDKLSGKPDIYDLNQWPKAGPRPQAKLLADARNTLSLLGVPGSRCALIAGVNQPTITDFSKDNGGFKFTYSNRGDGTVPLDCAVVPGVPTYYVEGVSHGNLPNSARVTGAVVELIEGGTPSKLSRTLPIIHLLESRSAETAALARTRAYAPILSGGKVDMPAFRDMMRAYAASDPEELETRTALFEDTGGNAGIPGRSLRMLNVSRRDGHRIEIQAAKGSITEVRCRAVVLGVFRGVRPTGAAQEFDVRMEGAITEIAQRRMFACDVGEVFILPTGRHLVRPDLVLFAGLGAFDTFGPATLDIVSESVIRTLIRSDVEDFATVLVGAASGQEIPDVLYPLLKGFFRGLVDADKQRRFKRITICENDPARYDEICGELWRLSSTPLFKDIDVVFDEIPLPRPIFVDPAQRAAVVSGPPNAYLNVQCIRDDGNGPLFRVSILTAEGKAAVISDEVTVATADIDALLWEVRQVGSPTNPFHFEKVPDFGKRLAEKLLPERVRQAAATLRDNNLVVVHDAAASRIPWETLHIDGMAPALEGGMSRRYLSNKLSIAKWLQARHDDEELVILLVVNPTGDLKGADAEGERIRSILSGIPGIRLVTRIRNEATKAKLKEDIGSGLYDVIHYAGHAFFDAKDRSRSGVCCAGGEVLSGADLAELGQLPHLAVFNACESGRLRLAAESGVQEPEEEILRAEQGIEEAMGLAEAFLCGGIANYLGTYWPVSDSGAKEFASSFYTALQAGSTLGEALLNGRRQIHGLRLHDWANYILYGSTEFRLKTK